MKATIGICAVLLVASACGGSSKPSASASQSPSASATLPPNTVETLDYYFQPKQLEVKAGTKVTWVNTGAFPHRVYSMTKLFDSNPGCQTKGSAPYYKESTGCLDRQQTFSYTFANPGRYFYVCPLHSLWEESQRTDTMADHMAGVVIVT